MKLYKMRTREIKSTIACFWYLLCILYMAVFTCLYNITGFPYVTIFLMMILTILHAIYSKKIPMNRQMFFLFLFILLNFLVAFLVYNVEFTKAYFISFITLGIMGFYFSTINVNTEKVLNYVGIVFIIYMLLLGGRQDFMTDYFNMSNAMLPGVCTLIMLTFSGMNEKKLFKSIIYGGFSLYFFYFLLSKGSRSTVVALLGFVAIYILVLTNSKLIKTIVISGIGVLVILALNIEKVLIFLDGWFAAKGISLYFITKSIEKMNGKSGITSGRNSIAKKVFEFDNIGQILWGRGISGFEATSGIYPHNLMLHFFSEYGIIGVIFLTAIMITTIQLLRVENENNKKMLVLLFGTAIIPLFFSFAYWRYPTFFLYIGKVLIRKQQLGLKIFKSKKRIIREKWLPRGENIKC